MSHVEKNILDCNKPCLVICRMEIKVLGCDSGWMAAGFNRERAFPPVVLTHCYPSVCGFVGTPTARSIMRGIFEALFPHYLTTFLQKSLVQSHKHVPRYEESSVSLQQLDLLIVLEDCCLMKPWMTCLVHQLLTCIQLPFWNHVLHHAQFFLLCTCWQKCHQCETWASCLFALAGDELHWEEIMEAGASHTGLSSIVQEPKLTSS